MIKKINNKCNVNERLFIAKAMQPFITGILEEIWAVNLSYWMG